MQVRRPTSAAIRLLSLVLAALAGLCGCSRPQLIKSPDLPGAEGRIAFRKTRDARTSIELEVKRLTQPEELLPPGYLYVAWVRADAEARPLNMGALELDKDLNGKLRALTHLKRFEVFVTAESSLEIDDPTGLPLLWARRQ